jgi:hypothetical protein
MRRFAPIRPTRAVRLVLAGCLMALWGPPTASAEGPPEAIEVRVETGTADGQRRFIPDELNFERGKYYKLVIHNPSPHAHYFSSEGLGVRVFTGKIELTDGAARCSPRSTATCAPSSSHLDRRWPGISTR